MSSVKSRSLSGSFSVADLDREGAPNLNEELPSDEPPCIVCGGDAGAPDNDIWLDGLVDLFPLPLGIGIGADPPSSLRSLRSATAARTSA